ncbi:MAG: hypothetical protein EHM79_00035, partial [Geobacter sp.]
MISADRPRLLLHMCCAGCSPHVADLLRQAYTVTGFFYNPNIHPAEEYQLRRKEALDLGQKLGMAVSCGEYDAERWFDLTRGMELEPEGGSRCAVCFRMRLEQAARQACEDGCSFLTTTLTVSPHKNAETINRIGSEAGEKYGVTFLQSNFKKQDGFRKTMELSQAFGLYRQDYCGCL